MSGIFNPSANGGGMTPIVLTPLANHPPSANYATPDVRNGQPVLDFDGSTDEEAVFLVRIPENYSGGGLTVETEWSLTSATTGSFRVQVALERQERGVLDTDADSFAAFKSGGGTAPGTSGIPTQVAIAFSDGAEIDGLAAGEWVRVKVRRDADGTSGADDINTDAELRGVCIRET